MLSCVFRSIIYVTADCQQGGLDDVKVCVVVLEWSSLLVREPVTVYIIPNTLHCTLYTDRRSLNLF